MPAQLREAILLQPLTHALPALAVLLALLLLAAAWWWRARRRYGRRRKPVRRRAPRHPVVLMHGLFGFDSVEVGSRKWEYFRGVPTRLERAGAKVHVVRVASIGAIEKRAEQLAEQVRAIGSPRVNVIAHSMGGVDARFALARLGLADKVASLTTVGTPHRGTPLADIGSRVLGRLARSSFLGGVHGATTKRMKRFNGDVEDVRGVGYFSVTASTRDVSKLLLPGWAFLHGMAGENDGIVPLESQQWGELIEQVDADHWAQIGWGSHPFDAPDFYARLVRELRARGF